MVNRKWYSNLEALEIPYLNSLPCKKKSTYLYYNPSLAGKFIYHYIHIFIYYYIYLYTLPMQKQIRTEI